MYVYGIQWALDRGYQVRSSGYTSKLAKRIWDGQTLKTHFNITKSGDSPYEIWIANSRVI
jgi:hypothetical protein